MLILKEAARPRTGAWAWAGSCWATWTAGPASTATAKHDRAAAGQTGEGHGVGGGLGHGRDGEGGTLICVITHDEEPNIRVEIGGRLRAGTEKRRL